MRNAEEQRQPRDHERTPQIRVTAPIKIKNTIRPHNKYHKMFGLEREENFRIVHYGGMTLNPISAFWRKCEIFFYKRYQRLAVSTVTLLIFNLIFLSFCEYGWGFLRHDFFQRTSRSK